MKFFISLLSIVLLISSQLRAQDVAIPTKNGDVFYELVDSVQAPKEKLFARSREWLAKTAGNAKEIIQMDDPSSGKIVAKGLYKASSTALGYAIWEIYCTVTIDTRDNRYRIQLSDFTYGDGRHSISEVNTDYLNGKHRKTNGGFLRNIDEGARNLLLSFQKAMKDNSNDF